MSKKIKCKYCKEQFYSVIDLVAHSMVHSDEAVQKCISCEKEFTTRKNLLRHIRMCHGFNLDEMHSDKSLQSTKRKIANFQIPDMMLQGVENSKPSLDRLNFTNDLIAKRLKEEKDWVSRCKKSMKGSESK